MSLVGLVVFSAAGRALEVKINAIFKLWTLKEGRHSFLYQDVLFRMYFRMYKIYKFPIQL